MNLEEMERQKKLILEGKVPVEEAPEELMEHPVFKVAEMAKKIIESRNIQQKSATFSVVSTYYYDMEESDEAARREAEEVLGITAGRKKSAETKTDECGLIESTDFMFTPEEYERLKYEMPLVKQLRQLETVDDLYALADDIIGPLKTMKRGQHCGTRGKN
ncbi:hypothetical protein C0J52_17854 [Blattella germanica]|nr:hypothetical protein C0J52_17854 [Blattella germanica]